MKKSKKCVYCGGTANLTREHVFPQFLNSLLPKDRSLYFIGGTEKFVGGAPTVRDVCTKCNNDALGALDDYGKELTNRYFIHDVESIPVQFEYKYDLLLRWLLKVLYNAARSFKVPSSVFKPYVPYILGEMAEPPITVLLAGIWKPSMYRGEKYYPTEIGVSNLIVPDKSGDLELASMFSVQSYVFMVLGWANTPSSESIQQTVNLVSSEFGVVLVKSEQTEVILDPAKSKLDYITHKIHQGRQNPHWIVDMKDVRRFAPGAREIPVGRLPELKRIYCKAALVTLTLDAPRFAIFASERIHPGLVVGSFQFEQTEQVLPSERALAYVRRKRRKTYVNIIDLHELDAPFFSSDMGTIQSDQNWIAWRTAIAENDNFLLIGVLPSNLDCEQMEFVSKIKVAVIED